MGLALALQGQAGVYSLAADTDGIAGLGQRGRLGRPHTLARASALGMTIDHCIDRNDAYGYFGALDDLLITGPTFTNVNDCRAVLVL